jgi:hypothetical protein
VAGPATRPRAVIARVLTLVCGLAMGVFGLWSLFWPSSFGALIAFPPSNEHLLHDAGAFQLGLAVALVAALVISDALTVALLGFVVADAVHTVNHLGDRHLGGHDWDAVVLGALAVLALVALVLRLRPPPSPNTQPAPPRGLS